MLQQVNLYQDIVKPHGDKIRPSLYGWLLLTGLLLITGMTLHTVWTNHSLNNAVELAQQQLKIETAHVEQLIALLPPEKEEARIRLEIERYQAQLKELSQSLQLLKSDNAMQIQGFSGYFQALSNQAFQGLWLKHIYLSSEPPLFKFEGSTLKPKLIAGFIQKLQKEAVFQGQHFSSLTAEQSPTEKTSIDFSLATTSELLLESEPHAK
ncbi:MAG: hypothetical protein Q7U98_13495 [Methylicorpusculum sp.]|nr:hypothetical protein [Methylicorpusculum sp.]MDO8842969.1 hypothetical protein [Methylicorpusculum sp.]MDO8940161.1 hypothetical protein [Methylicorpusculum sp.]MDP2202198.1 hypothetical protein [Methylicorpusculum sp.]